MTPAETGLDLLAVEAFTYSPSLETTCEVCLRYADQGLRVGFAFLDIENVDQFPIGFDSRIGALMYRAGRRSRMARVRAIEEILRSRGVSVITMTKSARPNRRLTCARAGISSVEALRGFRHQDAALGLGVLSSLIRHTQDSNPDFAVSRPVADRLLDSAYQAFTLTQELIAEYKPDSVLIFNGRFGVAKGISEAARIAGVRRLFHELVSTHDRFYLSDFPIHNVPNTRKDLAESWASAPEGRELVAAQYFTRDRGGIALFETQFMGHQQRCHNVPDTGRRRIAYFMSSIDEFAAVEDGFENPLFESQHAAVEWLASWVRERRDCELVIRMHPRMGLLADREQAWWDSLAAVNVLVLEPSSPVDSYELAASAARVVCYHSSMGVEASYAGKVSILVGDADYCGLDCVYEPGTVDELSRMLMDEALTPKPQRNCLPFGYQRLMRGDKFAFYEPHSFQEGSFFGRRIPSASERSISERIVTRILRGLAKKRATRV